MKKNKLNKSNILAKLDPQSKSNSTKKNPKSLLSFNRLDIAFKLFYLKYRTLNERLAISVYKEHINILSLGTFIEPDDPLKNSFNKFINTFKKIERNIITNGFNKNTSLIPLSQNGSIINGSHRVSVCVFHNKYLYVNNTQEESHCYNYNFFLSRGVSKTALELAVNTYIEFSDKCYIAIFWPSSSATSDEIEKNISKILYRKKITLSFNGLVNLVSEVYKNESWLRDNNQEYSGAIYKAIECSKKPGPIQIVVFEEESLSKVRKIKSRLRNYYSLEKHSVHITDSKHEATQLSKILLNDNSIHFLNYSDILSLDKFKIELDNYKNYFHKKKIPLESFVFDGGSVLNLYGIRNASDFDIILDDKFLNLNNTLVYKKLQCHDSELKYHKKVKSELIYNPEMYFYFDGFKFISFAQIYFMKNNRRELKDLFDLKLMNKFTEKSYFSFNFIKINQSFIFSFFKIKILIIMLLKKTKLFSFVRLLFRMFKSKN